MDTVDGSEIRRSPVEVGSLSMFIPLFTRFEHHPRWLFDTLLPSTVSPDLGEDMLVIDQEVIFEGNILSACATSAKAAFLVFGPHLSPKSSRSRTVWRSEKRLKPAVVKDDTLDMAKELRL